MQRLKLAESAEAVKKYGLMPTKTPGVSHAMIGEPGHQAVAPDRAGSVGPAERPVRPDCAVRIPSRGQVKSSNQITTGVLDYRGRLGIESGHEAKEAKRWGQAAAEVRDKVLAAASEGANAAELFGAGTFDRATGVFRPVDIDGDGTPDQPRAAAAAEEAGAAIKGTAAGIAGAGPRSGARRAGMGRAWGAVRRSCLGTRSLFPAEAI